MATKRFSQYQPHFSLFLNITLWLGLFCFYTYTLIWGTHWHDVGEWISASWVLAPAHPPSHPIALTWIHSIERMLFLGDIYWRGNVSSALAMSLSFVFSYQGLKQWLKDRPIQAVLLSFWAYLLPLCWLQAIRTEVYALQQLLSAMILWALSHYHFQKDQRYLLLTAFLIGMIGCNHTLLSICLGIPLLLWLIYTQRFPFRHWLIAASTVILGLSPYLLVILRGQKGGIWGWPWIDSIQSFWDNLSGRLWSQQVQKQHGNLNIHENINALIKAMVDELGIISFLSILVILLLATPKWVFKSNEAQRQMPQPFALFLLGNLLFVLSTNFIYAYNPINPDVSGYFCAAIPAFVLLIGNSLRLLKPQLSSLLLLCLFGGYQGYDLFQRQEARFAEVWAKSYTTALPSRGVFLSSYYSNHFNWTALQLVEGWRSDLSYLFRGQRKNIAYWHRIEPSLQSLAQSELWGQCHRPVFWETESLVDQEKQYWHRLLPVGFAFWIQAPQFMALKPLLEAQQESFHQELKNINALNDKDIQGKMLDIDSAYSLTFFELEQARYLGEILPYQPWERRSRLTLERDFFEQAAKKWIKKLDQ